MKLFFKDIFLIFGFCVLCGGKLFSQNLPTGQAGKKIDSLENLLKTVKEDSVRVNELNNLSYQMKSIGDFDSAMTYALKAKSLSEKINFNKGLGNAYNN